MEKLKMKLECYYRYINTVKGNQDVDFETAAKKMTRNRELAIAYPRKDGCIYYQYGRLHFLVHDNTVVWIKNYCPTHPDWKKSKLKYLKLNKELGIDEGITLVSLFKDEIKHKIKKWRKNILKISN